MIYDAGSLAQLFGVNFAPSFHYQLPNPSGYRTGTELYPIQTAGGGVLANTRSSQGMYYNNGFLPAGGGQITGGGTSILSSVVSGLSTFLPAIFGKSSAAGSNVPATIPTVRTPPMLPGGNAGGPLVQRIGTAVINAATGHPILTAAGGAAATAGGAVLARRMGRKTPTVTQHPDGTVTVKHHRRMNPCNIKALRRGLRRAHAFERVATKVLHITARHKHISGFKSAKRRKR